MVRDVPSSLILVVWMCPMFVLVLFFWLSLIVSNSPLMFVLVRFELPFKGQWPVESLQTDTFFSVRLGHRVPFSYQHNQCLKKSCSVHVSIFPLFSSFVNNFRQKRSIYIGQSYVRILFFYIADPLSIALSYFLYLVRLFARI